MITLPIVIVAWSPIGYETYLCLTEMYGAENILLVSARNFDPPEARFSMGARHDHFSQTDGEIELACASLTRCVAEIRDRGDKFTLCAPQMGNFYTRTLFESNLCTDLIIYDEGSAAYFENFMRLQQIVWIRNEVKPRNALCDYFNAANIEFNNLKNAYLKGVKFYDLKHPKIRSLISFFPDAFDKLPKIQLPFKKVVLSDTIDQKNDVLILLPSIRKIKMEAERQKYIVDIKKLKSENLNVKFIVKPHPSDFNVQLDEYRKILSLPVLNFYHDYMIEKRLNPFREPALAGFETIITYNNSTHLYITQLQKMSS